MKVSKGNIILIVILVFLVIMGIKNLKNEKSLNQSILKEVTLVADGKVNPDNNGKLVLVSGKISFEGNIGFLELENPIESFKVVRTVQDFVSYKSDDGKTHYEWKERKEEDRANVSDSSSSYLFSTTQTIPVKVGEFNLDDKGMELVNASASYVTKEIAGLEYNGLEYTNKGHDDPEPGDVSLSYTYFDCSKYDSLSILAKQTGTTFSPYTLGKEEVYRVYNGKVDTMEKLTQELDEQVQRGKRGKIAFIILILVVAGVLFYNSKKQASEGKKESSESKAE